MVFFFSGLAVNGRRAALRRKIDAERRSGGCNIAEIGWVTVTADGKGMNRQKNINHTERTKSNANRFHYPLIADFTHIVIDKEKRAEGNNQKGKRNPDRRWSVDAVPALQKWSAE